MKKFFLVAVLFFTALSVAAQIQQPTPNVTTSLVTVTNASQTFGSAVNNRRLLIIQNNDAAGIIYVTFDETATTSKLKINPGGHVFWDAATPTGQINIIGSIANNPNVVIVEGY